MEVLAMETRGPTDLAGLRAGDMIVTMNEKDVQSVDDLHRFLSEWPIGRTVEIGNGILRGQRRLTWSIVPRKAVV